ncbi:MAG TPA: DUF3822 family protein [Flavobacteriaceae bacterium]|nr:DUF3822 family protein [Flavobacteriaceae bacterium]
MIKRKSHLKSNHLDIHKVERKQLSIQFSLDGFSFSVFDIDLQEFIVFKEYVFESKKTNPEKLLTHIKQVFLSEEILSVKFEKILVVHVNNLSTFVPFPLFEEDHLDTYIKFNNKIYNSDFFVYDFIVNQDMVSVFVPYINVNNFLIDQFGSFEYKHYSSILVENLLSNYANSDTVKVFVNINKSHFEIIIGKQKKLLLYNTFEYKTVEDFIYYVLFSMDQLQLNVEDVELELLGKIKEEDGLFIALYKYVRNVSLLKYKPKYNSLLSITDVYKRENFCLFNTID